jgi:transcriptional regulator with XRE-family HTH domain
MQLNGQKIRRLREDLGMTGRDLCNAASISPPFLSQIENGSRNCSPPVAARLAAALDVAISELRLP